MCRFLTLSKRSSSAWISASSCIGRDWTRFPFDDHSIHTTSVSSESAFDLFQMSKAELEDLFLFVVLSQGQSDSEVKESSLNIPNFNKTGDSKLTAEVRWASGRGPSRCR